MKSSVRYAVTIMITAGVTAAISVALFGNPAGAQPAPKVEQGSAISGSGGSTVVPPVVTGVDKNEPAAGSDAQPVDPAKAAAEAGAGSAAPAAPEAAKKKKPLIVAVDCAIAPKDALVITTDAKGYTPGTTVVEVGKIVKFVMPASDDVQPYPDKEPGLVAPANATTCLRFDAPGEHKFHAKGRPIEGTITAKMWFDILADRHIQEEGNFWLPKAVNIEADSTDQMFIAVLALSILCFVAIAGAVVYLTIKYRHRPGHKPEPSAAHNDALEITWTVIPTIICVFLFYYGWRTYVKVVTPPTKAVEVQVLAWRWNWQFTHPNGVQDKDLHVPVNTPVRLVMTSKDVLHAFYAPVMRVKQDIIPRRYTYAWFFATKPGTYRLTCAEYCGTDHSQMGISKDGRRAVVVVHEPGKYEQYLADASIPVGDPKEIGARLYDKKGCVSCHTTDGTAKIGPSFKGSWGKPAALADGTSVPFDETYVRESLMTPQKKLHAGFPPSMPSFEGQLKEFEIEGIIAFLQSLK